MWMVKKLVILNGVNMCRIFQKVMLEPREVREQSCTDTGRERSGRGPAKAKSPR